MPHHRRIFCVTETKYTNSPIKLKRYVLYSLFRVSVFFSLYFYFVDDEQIERKAAKSNNRPTNNRCRIPIDDKIYFYIFLKVEVKLAVPSIVYWYRAYTYAIHWNFDFWWAFSGSALLSHCFFFEFHSIWLLVCVFFFPLIMKWCACCI